LRLRRIAAAVAIATAIIVPATSTAALAAIKLPVSPVVVTKPAPKTTSPTVVSAAAKIPRAAKIPKASTDTFTATGTVTSVNAGSGTVTLKVKGGTSSMLGRTVTVKVPSSVKPAVNGKTATLAKVARGYAITVNGTVSGSTFTATKVVATG
jgi:hypothetical protein